MRLHRVINFDTVRVVQSLPHRPLLRAGFRLHFRKRILLRYRLQSIRVIIGVNILDRVRENILFVSLITVSQRDKLLLFNVTSFGVRRLQVRDGRLFLDGGQDVSFRICVDLWALEFVAKSYFLIWAFELIVIEYFHRVVHHLPVVVLKVFKSIWVRVKYIRVNHTFQRLCERIFLSGLFNDYWL